jgi:hypothetical protein
MRVHFADTMVVITRLPNHNEIVLPVASGHYEVLVRDDSFLPDSGR